MESIAKYKKNYPIYKNVPDIELADFMYNKFYKEKEVSKENFYLNAFPELADEIVENQGIISPDDEMFMPEGGRELLNFRPTVGMIAERSGVSIDDPAYYRARFGQSLGINPDQRALAIKNSLSKLYKQDIDVRTGSNTGELEYYNPKTKKYALVDKPGADLGDFADLGGDALVILPDLITTIFTAGAGKAIGLGAAAAGAGEYARLKLGQAAYDINKFNPDGSKVTEMQLAGEAAKTAGVSLAFGAGGLGIAKSIKGINNIIKGRIAPDDLVDYVGSKNGAEDLSRQINDKLEEAGLNSRLKFKTSQAFNDPDLMAVQQKMETSPRLGFVEDFTKATTKEMDALNDFFSLLRSEFDPKGLLKNQNQYDVDNLIKGVIKKRNEPQIKSLIKEQEVTENLLNQTINELPNGNKVATGVNVRSAIEDTRKIFKKNSDEALKKLDEAAGGVKIKSDIFGKAIKELDDKQLDTIFNSSDPSIAKTLRGDEILDGSAIVDVNTLRNSMSYLNRQIRKGEKGLTTEDIDIGAYKYIVGKINEQIRRDAPDSFVSAFDTFNDIYSKGKLRLDETIVKDVMKIKNKRLSYAYDDVFDITFKKGTGSKRVAEDLHDVIKDYPDAMLAYKSSINDFYKKKVIDNNKVNLTEHKNFIKNYEDNLKVFFNPKEYNQITKIGGLQKTINNIEKTREDIIKKLSQSFEGKLQNASSGELLQKIYKPNNIGQIKELKRILSKDPEIFQSFQNSVLKDLNERVTVKHGTIGLDVLSPERFKSYIYGSGGEKGYQFALKEIFGEAYMKNLRLLNDSLQITARKAPAKLAEEGVYGNIVTDFIRVKVGQFTQAGRLLTAGKRIYHKTSNQIMKNAILNPENLADLMKLKKLNPKSAEAAYILGKLNGMLYFDQTQDGER
jgi:hypothetical protein